MHEDYVFDAETGLTCPETLAEAAQAAVLGAQSHTVSLPVTLQGAVATIGDLALDLACTSTEDGETVGNFITPCATITTAASLVLLDTALWLSPKVREAVGRFAYSCTYKQTV